MIMDGIKKYPTRRIEPPILETKTEIMQKPSIWRLPLKHKFATLISLVSLLTFTLPHQTFAAGYGPVSGQLVFVIGTRITYIDTLEALQLSKIYERKKMRENLDRQIELNIQVKNYLKSQGSPLATYTSTLLSLNNWKKIIALSNAESGLCKHYPVNKSNCWGVGGANLWYMGSNLGEGIVSMNHFLNTYPNNSKVKYSQMNFKQMNGLYKQPAAQHWVDNNQVIYDDLTAIENSL